MRQLPLFWLEKRNTHGMSYHWWVMWNGYIQVASIRFYDEVSRQWVNL